MEEMHRTHKEPVWSWIDVVAQMIRNHRKMRARPEARVARLTAPRQVVTPWSPRSSTGWSA